jgi:hypothetical protein
MVHTPFTGVACWKLKGLIILKNNLFEGLVMLVMKQRPSYLFQKLMKSNEIYLYRFGRLSAV